MKVFELMTMEPDAAEPDWTLAKAMARMEELGVRHLPVVERGRLAGVLSERDLLEATGWLPDRCSEPDGAEKRVRDFMSVPPVAVDGDEEVEVAVDLLLDGRLGCLPVVRAGDQLVGILTVADLLAAHVRACAAAPAVGPLDGVIAARMSAEPIAVDVSASGAQILGVCRSSGVRHLPVVSDGWFVGLVSDRDLRRTAGRGELDLPASQIMTRHVTTLGPETLLSDAVELMLSARIDSIPVTNDGRLTGILTTTDVLRHLRDGLAAGSDVLRGARA